MDVELVVNADGRNPIRKPDARGGMSGHPVVDDGTPWNSGDQCRR
jgi:hypothetical protein